MIDKILCTGCGACVEICTQNSIKMVPDTYGFLYPHIDKKTCIHCNRCIDICPISNPVTLQKYSNPYVLAARNKEENIRLQSSSGGIFSLFAENILNNGGVVFGAALSEDCRKVNHILIEHKSMISQLRGSKYVQSYNLGTYSEVKGYLDSGQFVLYTGTPCQIGGLQAFLGKEYYNLYTQDVICHGVPAPKVWEEYIKNMEQSFTSVSKNVSFRSKKFGWKNFSMKIEFNNENIYEKTLLEDPFLQGFLHDLYSRTSCSNCKFKDRKYLSDITLADFWGIERIFPNLNDNRGVSLVVINTEKGKKLIEAVGEKAEIVKVNLNDAMRNNLSYYHSTKASPLRKSAMRSFQEVVNGKKDFNKWVYSYCGKNIKVSIKRKIAKLFNYLLRRKY